MAHDYENECGTFQSIVYTIVHEGTKCSLGCFPNFKKAYERIEKLAKGGAIIDCGNDCYNLEAYFSVVNTKKNDFGMYITVDRYVVYMSALTICTTDEIVPLSLFIQQEEENYA